MTPMLVMVVNFGLPATTVGPKKSRNCRPTCISSMSSIRKAHQSRRSTVSFLAIRLSFFADDRLVLKGDREFDYAWYNKGGKTIEQQYMTFQNGWHPDGPCQGGTREVNGKEYEPIQAQTQQERVMIYFCPIVWKMKESLASSAKNVKKKDLLDDYRTPSSVLLHEMTHQLFRSRKS